MNPSKLVRLEKATERERDHIISRRGWGGVSHSQEGKFNEIEIKTEMERDEDCMRAHHFVESSTVF